LLVNGELVPSLAQAGALVRRVVAEHARAQAVIAADRAVPYGRVIELIDLVKHEGISSFALDVERTTASPQSGTP
jgi:biopolymer transport protein ExbD